jgi:hypothetical protein
MTADAISGFKITWKRFAITPYFIVKYAYKIMKNVSDTMVANAAPTYPYFGIRNMFKAIFIKATEAWHTVLDACLFIELKAMPGTMFTNLKKTNQQRIWSAITEFSYAAP